MDITAIASAVSSNSSAQLQSRVSLAVLKKAIEMQQSQAALLLQALPEPAGPSARALIGGNIDTFA